jgi:RNA polymerase sigma-70 factor (ECF subfamily)
MHQASHSELSDEEVIERLQTGASNRYFEVVYHRYHRRVLDKCYGLVKNKELAKELAEDIFSKVFEKLPTFKQKSSFSTWLYSITYNHCIDYLREKKKLHYPSWNSEQEMNDIPMEDEQLDINYESVLSVMELIHPEEKELLLMKYMDNLSLKQISKSLRISENATKMRLKRARTRLLYIYEQKYSS